MQKTNSSNNYKSNKTVLDMAITEDLPVLKYDANRIAVGQLQQNMYEIIKQVQKGCRKLITRSGKVVAVLSPIREAVMIDELLQNTGA